MSRIRAEFRMNRSMFALTLPSDLRMLSVAALLVAPAAVRAQESGIPIGSKPPSGLEKSCI